MKDFISFHKNRIRSLDGRVRILFSFVFSVLILNEFILNKWPAYMPAFYDFGQMVLKLSYSFVGAIIVYYFNIHLSKEKKKIKTFGLVIFKCASIDFVVKRLINLLLNKQLNDLERESLTKEELYEASDNIYFGETIYSFNDYRTDKWYGHIYYTKMDLKKLINELISLNESIDVSILEHLYDMDNILDRDFKMEGMEESPVSISRVTNNGFYDLHRNNQRLQLSLQTVKQKGYAQEYMDSVRAKMK